MQFQSITQLSLGGIFARLSLTEPVSQLAQKYGFVRAIFHLSLAIIQLTGGKYA
jgi:hypothetical protein